MPRNIGFAFVAMVIGLAACISQEEMRADDEADCVSFGFQRGTPDFANCLQQESLAQRSRLNSLDAAGWYGPLWYAPPPLMRR
jgi:hypothetical protein